MDTNVIYCGDNLEVLPKYVPDESVDLIYIDPPFNSSRNYEVFWGEAQERRAFQDRFGDVTTYMEWMRPRIRELHRVLKPTGSFYYHCDPHASHYIKVELDRILGYDSFRSEIIWHRTPAKGLSSRQLPNNHDSIFLYQKGQEATWNIGAVIQKYNPNALDAKTAGKYSHHEADGRLYRLDSLINPNRDRPNLTYEFLGVTKVWRWTKDRMQAAYDAGLVIQTRPGTVPQHKRYLDEQRGRFLGDVWTDIPPLNSQAKERLGYPTQKPLALLERIVLASSNPNDVVLDAFCGCGTTVEAAAKHKRKWIGIDFSPTACRVMAERLENRLGLKEGADFTLLDMPKTADQLHRMPHFEFENWAVVALGGIPNKVKVGDYGIDGRLYLADISKERRGDFLETLDVWYPIQVKQQEHVGRPDIDKFETAMRRDKRLKGYFVAFGFTADATREIQRANANDGLDIVPITVAEILEHERVATTI